MQLPQASLSIQAGNTMQRIITLTILCLLFLTGCNVAHTKSTTDDGYWYKELEGVKVEQVRFFECGYNGIPWGDIPYDTTFDSSAARYIACELALDWSDSTYKDKVVYFSIGWNAYKADGTQLFSETFPCTKKEDMTETAFWKGKGNKAPGYWEPGKYTVKVFLNKREVAQSGFVVK